MDRKMIPVFILFLVTTLTAACSREGFGQLTVIENALGGPPAVSPSQAHAESDISHQLSRALAQVEDGKFGPALHHLDLLIEETPESTEARLLRAAIESTKPLGLTGLLEHAETIASDIEAVLEVDPNHTAALFLRAWRLTETTDAQLIERALSDLDKVLLRESHRADTHALHGMLALWSGEYETAAAAFERARQLDAAVADDYAIAAITPFAAPEVESPTSITRVAQLLEDVNRSLSEDPNWAAGYAIRGLASLTDEDDIESALADLVEYTRLSIEAETFSSQKTGSVDVWSMTRAATKRYANATVEMVLSTFIHFAVMGQLQLSDDLANRIVNLELPLSVSGIELPGIGAAIEAAAISADGSHIAVLSGDMGSELSLWDATTGANIFSTTIGTPGIGCSSGNPLAYDPRGRTIAAISCDQVFIVDVNTGQFVARIPDAARHQPDLASVAYSQSGNEIVVSTINGWIDVWATETGEHLQSIVPDATAGSVVSAFDEFSNSVLAVGSNNRLSRWDATSGKKIEDVFDIGSTVLTLYPVIGTDLIAATFIDDNRIELIEMGSGRVVQTLIGHRDYILDVCTSTDARYIASAGADGSVLVWDVTTGNLVTILGHQALASSVCFGPDRNTLVSSGWDGTVRVWDVSNETERLIISVTE